MNATAQPHDLLIGPTSEACELEYVDEARVALVRQTLRTDAVYSRLADLFRMLADPSRTRILAALAVQELCVCDLARVLSLSASAVSHQLRLLRTARLVANRREGKMIYYRLADRHVLELLEAGLEHSEE